MPKPGFSSITIPTPVYAWLKAELAKHNAGRVYPTSIAEFVCLRMGVTKEADLKSVKGLERQPRPGRPLKGAPA